MPEALFVSETDLAADLCKKSFSFFCREFWDVLHPDEKLIWGWHNDYMCRVKQRAAERVFLGLPKEYDLLFNVPPGTTKSTIESVMFPPWTWTNMPHARHICSSHTQELVHDLARQSRDIVQSEKYQRYFPGIGLREDQRTKGYYINTRGGFRLSVTVGGKTPTGFHSHFLSADDPIDPKKAISVAEIKTANDFMVNTLSTRKVNRSVTLTTLVMQRLAQNDPSGDWLEREKDSGRVKHVCLPAELTDDVRPRGLRKNYINGLLDPVRMTRDNLEEEKAKGNFFYAGQFLQNPVPRGGLMFDTEKLKKALPPEGIKFKRIVRSWDNACLVAGTLVETSKGLKPIEEVVSGDLVLTRGGFRKVRFAGETKKANELVSVLFSNGSIVTGTPEHLVWTENRGWIALGAMCGGDYNLGIAKTTSKLKNARCQEANLASQEPSTSSSKGLLIQDCRERDTFGQRALEVVNSGASRYIEQSGKLIMVVSPRAIMFITRMTTGTIIQLKDLSVCLQRSMHLNTFINGMAQGDIEDIWKEYDPSLMQRSKNGFIRRKEKQKHKLMEGQWRRELLGTQKNVLSVGVFSSSNHILGEEGSVATNVDGDTKVGNLGNQKQKSAFGVRKNLRLGGVEISALNDVLENGIGQRDVNVPVYDIEVEEHHEFFANGVLVHNSVASGGDFTAGVKIGLTDEPLPRVWIFDVERGQWDTNDRERLKDKIANRDGPQVIVVQEQEPGSGGKDTATTTTIRMGVMGFKVETMKPTGDKELRADPFSQQVNAGNVYLVPAPWNAKFIEELKYFPHGVNDDQVDAASTGYNKLREPRRRVGGMW